MNTRRVNYRGLKLVDIKGIKLYSCSIASDVPLKSVSFNSNYLSVLSCLGSVISMIKSLFQYNYHNIFHISTL